MARRDAITVLAWAYMASLTLSSTCSAATIPEHLAVITQSAQPFVGVTYYRIAQGADAPQPPVLPRELVIHIVEIDPQAPGVSFFCSPGNGPQPDEYTRQTTSQFVDAFDLSLAINGDFYTTDTGDTANVHGLGVSDGDIVSPPARRGVCRNSLVILYNNEVQVIGSPTIPVGARNVVSGNQLLLDDGRVVAPDDKYTRTLNPHTAAGVDADTGHLFLLVVDGRQPDYSEGMRTDAIAELLLAFGVEDALNLDGGGSCTLVFADGADGAARTVNSPSDKSTPQMPGRERAVANHLGVYARPNPDYQPLPPVARPPAPAAAPAH